MIDVSLSRKILTIGNRCDVPDGGISQVLYSYRKHIFPSFNHIVNFKRGNIFFKIWLMVKSLLQLFFKLLFDDEIEIVHIHTASDNGFRRNIFYVNLSYLMRRKVILHIHSGRFNEYYLQNKNQVDKVFSKCEHIIALTPSIKSFYEKMGCRKVSVINNIIEYPVYRDRKFTDNAIHLLFLGVITKTKGIYDLLDVIIEHKDEFLGRIVLHVGGNKEIEKFQQLVDENKISDIVKYEGWISGNRKIDFLNSCDVFILPSYTEGLPISILEAQSYGLFTIATNVGGIPEIVNEKNGYLFDPHDKEKLYSILNQIIEDRNFLDNSHEIMHSADSYLPSFVEKQLETLYSYLINN